jgi:hypothetical protein
MLDADIVRCRLSPQRFSPKFSAWVNFLDLALNLSSLPLRLQLINGFVNVLIDYDYSKLALAQSDTFFLNWYQSPQETLITGKGVCGYIALVKYESALRLGFTPAQTSLCILDWETPNGEVLSNHQAIGHAILLVDLDGHQQALNNLNAFTETVLQANAKERLSSVVFNWIKSRGFERDSILETVDSILFSSSYPKDLPKGDALQPFALFGENRKILLPPREVSPFKTASTGLDARAFQMITESSLLKALRCASAGDRSIILKIINLAIANSAYPYPIEAKGKTSSAPLFAGRPSTGIEDLAPL